jgi:hypothetical protein
MIQIEAMKVTEAMEINEAVMIENDLMEGIEAAMIENDLMEGIEVAMIENDLMEGIEAAMNVPMEVVIEAGVMIGTIMVVVAEIAKVEDSAVKEIPLEMNHSSNMVRVKKCGIPEHHGNLFQYLMHLPLR